MAHFQNHRFNHLLAHCHTNSRLQGLAIGRRGTDGQALTPAFASASAEQLRRSRKATDGQAPTHKFTS